ncbi:MAG: Ppx/GppA phosphatase family protein [Castellaniella sp.]
MDHLLAAVDLGSNSFRLSVGRVVQQDGKAQIYAVDRLKETVRLAAGLGEDLTLDEAAVQRGLAVLQRFAERIEGFHPNRVRAVATNTLRIAQNIDHILPRFQAALGFPVDVISGQEEARLIFVGISHELPASPNRRLMIDIGGGSTETIIGKEFRPLQLASLPMGCLSYTERFFPDGKITGERMDLATLAARRELEAISRAWRRTGWQEAYGSSGTAKGLLAVLQEGGMSEKGITLAGLRQLRDKLVNDGEVRLHELPGLKPDRAMVLAGGLAIMLAAFLELGITRMLPGEGALRVGVLYDLLGRDSMHDKRDETVRQFMRRYQIDTRQAARVRQIALALFEQLALPADPEHQALAQALGWTAELHELGLNIAHADYHRHSAYILAHADMPGFSHDDQELLALLALGHQGKLGKLKALAPSHAQWMALLCLRLAVLLARRRENINGLPLRLHVDECGIRICIDARWRQTHPLSDYSLQRERLEWTHNGFAMVLHSSNHGPCVE